MYQALTLQAGVAVEFTEAGDFFRILESAPTDVSVIFYAAGREMSRAENIEAGYSEKFRAGAFDRVRISSATGGNIEFVMRLGNEVGYEKAPTGAVTIIGQQGAFTQANATVTNASAQLLAAKDARRYLLIQNKDTALDVYVTVDGGAATIEKGVKIEAGQALEFATYAPSGAVFALTASGSNANIVTVEG